jgi:hypothetical protein
MCEFVVDSGCSDSLLDVSVWKSLQRRPYLNKRAQVDIHTAGHETLRSLGRALIDMRIGNSVVQHEFKITNLGYCQGLLGQDFVNDHTLLCDVKSGRLVLSVEGNAREVIDLNPELRQEQSAPVSLCRHVTILPHHEIHLVGQTEKGKRFQAVLRPSWRVQTPN